MLSPTIRKRLTSTRYQRIISDIWWFNHKTLPVIIRFLGELVIATLFMATVLAIVVMFG